MHYWPKEKKEPKRRTVGDMRSRFRKEMKEHGVTNNNHRWQLKGVRVQDTHYGELEDALKQAIEIVLLESDYPKRLGTVTSISVDGPDGPFLLTLQTPNKNQGE